MECKICACNSSKIFEKQVLTKYIVSYYQCSACEFVQTEEPYWLDKAYKTAITSLDIGILIRNNFLLKNVSKIIDACFPTAENFLDYAGGYGLFARSMRDIGYNFYTHDAYCANLFANYFDIKDTAITKFDVVTAFEVFEHLSEPLQEIQRILKYSDHLIFSTEILPDNLNAIENWVYISQETGQHISFYSEKSLKIIANKFGKNYYRKGNIHIYTHFKFNQAQIDFALNDITTKKFLCGAIKRRIKTFDIRRESYQQRDYEKIKKILNS